MKKTGRRRRIVETPNNGTEIKISREKDVLIVVDAVQLRTDLIPFTKELNKLGYNTRIYEITLGENFFRFIESLSDKVTKVVYISVHDEEKRTGLLTFRKKRKVRILHFKGKFNKKASLEKIDKFISKN